MPDGKRMTRFARWLCLFYEPISLCLSQQVLIVLPLHDVELPVQHITPLMDPKSDFAACRLTGSQFLDNPGITCYNVIVGYIVPQMM